LRLEAGSDVQPITHYLDAVLTVLSRAAIRLRKLLHRLSRSVAVATARLRAHLDRLSHAAIGTAARLRLRLGRAWHAAAERRRPARPVAIAAPAPRLDPGRQWEIVMTIAAREVARAPAVAALHARAALKIDAAEHALSRIIADCAKILAAPVAAAAQPALQLIPQPEAPARRQLAA